MKKRSLWGARFRLDKAWGPGLGIAMVLVGTVIGAGFASGAEIMAYFTRYGKRDFWVCWPRASSFSWERMVR